MALEYRIDADLELGRHGGLVGELEALVDEHPLRERLRGQLMLALYRCGRQAEALDVYRAGRARLVADLGLEPGPALRELEAKILDQSPALDPPPPTERPAPKPRAAKAAEPAAPAAGRLRRLPLAIVLPIVAGAVLLAAVGLAIISETGEEPAAAPPRAGSRPQLGRGRRRDGGRRPLRVASAWAPDRPRRRGRNRLGRHGRLISARRCRPRHAKDHPDRAAEHEAGGGRTRRGRDLGRGRRPGGSRVWCPATTRCPTRSRSVAAAARVRRPRRPLWRTGACGSPTARSG